MKELIQGYLSHKNTWSAKKVKLTKTAVATVMYIYCYVTSLVAILNHDGDHVNIFNTVKLIYIAVLF